MTYGDNNNKGAILRKGNVGNLFSTTINDIILIETLKHNLLSISLLSKIEYKIIFTNDCCMIKQNEKKDYSFKYLSVNNIYMMNLDDVSLTRTKCLVIMNKDSGLRHKCLAHVNSKSGSIPLGPI